MNRYLAQIKGIDNPVVEGLKGKDADAAPALFGTWLGAIIGVLLIAGAIWALFQLMTGALQWISSGGDPEKLAQAQGRLRDAGIGLIVLFSSWAIYLLILNWLGVGGGSSGGLNFDFPTLF